MSNSVQPHRRQPTRLCHPWDPPGKNTGVDCHFLRIDSSISRPRLPGLLLLFSSLLSVSSAQTHITSHLDQVRTSLLGAHNALPPSCASLFPPSYHRAKTISFLNYHLIKSLHTVPTTSQETVSLHGMPFEPPCNPTYHSSPVRY